jgi:hypothetical protein
MKVGSEADYVVRVVKTGWGEPLEQLPLYEGMYSFTLNQVVEVLFLPRVTPDGPPWSLDDLPHDVADFTTPEQIRVLEISHTPYSVTPDDERADTAHQIHWQGVWPPEDDFLTPSNSPPPVFTVFFITDDEFTRLSTDLEELTHIAGQVQSTVRHSEVADHEAVRFVDQRILDSPWLRPRHAASVGRTG